MSQAYLCDRCNKLYGGPPFLRPAQPLARPASWGTIAGSVVFTLLVPDMQWADLCGTCARAVVQAAL